MDSSSLTTHAVPSLRRIALAASPRAAAPGSADAYTHGFYHGVDQALGRLGDVLAAQYDVPLPVASLVVESRRAWIENRVLFT